MNPLKTLLRHASHYLGGRVAVMALGFASFPIFTRAFSVSDYGMLNLIQNLVLLLTVLAKFGFQHSLQRYYPEHAGSADPVAIRRYYSTLFYGAALLGLLFSSLFIGAVVLGLGRFLGFTTIGGLVLASSLILVRPLRSMQLNLMQMESKTKLFNGMEILQKAVVIAITCLLLFLWSKTITAFFLGITLVEGAVVAQYVPVLVRRRLVSPTLFDLGFFRTAVVFSFPLMIAELSWIVLSVGDRFFVQHYLGTLAVGYYAAAYGIATYIQEVMMAPLQLSFFPICMKLWAAEGKVATQKFLSRSLNYFMMGSVLVVCVAIVTSQDIVVVLASKKFQQARVLLPYLVIGLVLWATNTFFRPGLMIHKRSQKIAQTTLFAGLLNIALNVVLLPRMGLIGAALASVLSFAAMLLFTAYASLRILPFKFEWAALLRYLLIGVAAAWAASLLPIVSPIPSALAKGTLIATVYGGALWLIDPKARELFGKAFSLITEAARGRRERSGEALTAAVEN